jgi:phosphoglycolate phosphatase-like HAD superfamily hydrolase
VTRDPSYEADFSARVSAPDTTSLLPGTAIELIREPAGRGRYRHVLFDFDGTLSLIREGWPEVMIQMMVELLLATPRHESAEELERLVRNYVTALTGKQTIYQMMRLAEEVAGRGGTPQDPLVYKRLYLHRLMNRIGSRREALRTGAVAPAEMLVPGAYPLLRHLADRGICLYLASGTDVPYVREEAELLGLTPFFGERVYGALDDYRRFSKARVIASLLEENRVDGAALLGFGDGYVEIDNIKSVGGAAVGVASDEAGRGGTPDRWKRERLLVIGADLIIADFREQAALLAYLFAE